MSIIYPCICIRVHETCVIKPLRTDTDSGTRRISSKTISFPKLVSISFTEIVHHDRPEALSNLIDIRNKSNLDQKIE